MEEGTCLPDDCDDLEQIAGGTGQAVDLPDGDDVSLRS